MDQENDSPSQLAHLERLIERRLLFVTGKGGVGKTTLCAALGVRAARLGKRALLCEVSSAPAFARIFGVSDEGFEPVEVADGLWATNCESRRCLVTFLSRFVRVRRVARAIVRNRISGHFFEAAPGVLETVVLERISHLSLEGGDQRGFDTVIVDLPSTGHAITFLDCPRTLARVIQTGRLADYLHALAGRLADPELAELVVVTQAEEMPVAEAIELWHAAHERLEIPLRSVIVNRVRRPTLPDRTAEQLLVAGAAGVAGSVELEASRLLHAWARREAGYIERLQQSIGTEPVLVPWIADHADERQLVEALAERPWSQSL